MNSNIYNKRRSGGQHGDVYTLPSVVSYMLDMVGYTADRDLSRISILEPSCGVGDFITEIVSRLYESSQRYNFDFNAAFERNIFAYDIDNQKIGICINRLSTRYNLQRDSFKHFISADFLLSNPTPVDVVVGNPPYIRYEEIPDKALNLYKALFSTFYFRPDIYVFFYEKTLRLLRQNGKHCFICANRWLKNTYGKKLRALISGEFSLDAIIDISHLQPFKETVLAYPNITLISNHESNTLVELHKAGSIETIGSSTIQRKVQPTSDDWSNLFTSNDTSDLPTIQEQGFHIGIGVATGCDDLYISRELPQFVEHELLIPCINARNLKGNSLNWDGRYLLNPYEADGKLIKLDAYPKAKAYLERKYDKLSSRYIARKMPLNWYATIDKIDRKLTATPKILIPDISGNTYLFIDHGHFYPQHNIYYITGGDIRSLTLLCALLMSSQIRQQLRGLTNRMNGGFDRWQSQYLRKLRIPDISSISASVGDALISKYMNMDFGGIDTIVSQIFEVQTQTLKSPKVSIKDSHKSNQLSFSFDYA